MNQLINQTKTHPSFGLALGGGGARGIAHIHVIEVLDELGLRPSVIAGTSIGAIYGAAYASGISGKEIRDYTLDLLKSKSSVMKRIYQKKPENLSDFFNPFTPSVFHAEAALEMILSDNVADRFSQTLIPFKAIATDFYAQKEAVLESGEIVPAIAASACLPVLLQPVMIGGKPHVDGGFVNPLPFEHIRGGVDFTIAVDVNGQPRPPRKSDTDIPGVMEVSMGVTQIVMGSLVREKLKSSRPDILLSPKVGEFLVMDFFRAREILVASSPIRDQLKRELERQFAKAGETL